MCKSFCFLFIQPKVKESSLAPSLTARKLVLFTAGQTGKATKMRSHATVRQTCQSPIVMMMRQ